MCSTNLFGERGLLEEEGGGEEGLTSFGLGAGEIRISEDSLGLGVCG